jgi:cyclophilin family peptidyl-prolyl cis-trans isomerase
MKKIVILIAFFSSTIAFSQNKYPNIILETSQGKIVIKLYDDTPLHSQNFVKLVNEHYYDSILFHRVIKNFMIQAGDPNSKKATTGQMLGSGGPDYMTPPEFLPKYYHKKGALAAARQGDNVNPYKYSSGSQFYIVVGQVLSTEQLDALVKQGRHLPFTPDQVKEYTTIGGTPHLDGAYTVFGEVIAGLDIVDKISNAQVDRNSRPINDIKIIKAYIKK